MLSEACYFLYFCILLLQAWTFTYPIFAKSAVQNSGVIPHWVQMTQQGLRGRGLRFVQLLADMCGDSVVSGTCFFVSTLHTDKLTGGGRPVAHKERLSFPPEMEAYQNSQLQVHK
jgi:hypothetical protein